ncbi:Ubiquitin specific iso-peptidase [Spraguea lophii 42_110]|uniref:Ubiquitin specific iso-peptidase n=1 Tax=Spraguea lophii (strain 42_110) TaxID=1358809 RepID=S7XFF9_SPRLO|nr:Ubiquitin specific iso-peptidase [Spraguea lophii 42_110]
MIISEKMLLENHPYYKEMGELIIHNYKYYYKNKRDGNCFYYAFIIAFLNKIKNIEEKEYKQIINKFIDSYQKVKEIKRKGLYFEDFYEMTIENISKIRKNENDIDFLKVDFNEITAYLKILISTQLLTRREKYEPFEDVDKLAAQVESFYRETGHVEIKALSDFLEIKITILSTLEPNITEYGNNSVCVSILYTHNHFEPLE